MGCVGFDGVLGGVVEGCLVAGGIIVLTFVGVGVCCIQVGVTTGFKVIVLDAIKVIVEFAAVDVGVGSSNGGVKVAVAGRYEVTVGTDVLKPACIVAN